VRLARSVAAGLFLLALPILIVTSNVRFAASEPQLWEWGFDRYDAEAATGIDRPQLDRAARDIAGYFVNDEPYLRTRVVVDERIQPLFNPRETVHMADVKDLMQAIFFLQALSLAYVLAYVVGVFVWTAEEPVRVLARQVLSSLLVLVVAAGVLAVTTLIGFESAFEQFHLLSFSNDFWQLDPDTDRLIQMFPEDFFFDMTLLIAGLTAAESLLLAGVSWWYLRRQDRGAEATLAPEGVRAV
jgi:integral membrane protein (TIGR01906 family)